MNEISELDQELLESYLDDGLSPAQVENVAQRLLAEPALAAAMRELRVARRLRQVAWQSMEPTPMQAAELAARISDGIARIERRGRLFKAGRIGWAVAASVAVFLAGWALHAAGSGGALAQETGPANSSRAASTPQAGPFQVALRDEQGHVIAVQKFSRADEARQFTDDLLRYEARRRELQHGAAMLVSDHF